MLTHTWKIAGWNWPVLGEGWRVCQRVSGTEPHHIGYSKRFHGDCIRSDRCQQVEGVRICSLCCKGSLWGYYLKPHFRSFAKVNVFGVGIGNEREWGFSVRMVTVSCVPRHQNPCRMSRVVNWSRDFGIVIFLEEVRYGQENIKISDSKRCPTGPKSDHGIRADLGSKKSTLSFESCTKR